MKTKKTYRDLINEVKSYNDIKVPSELRHPPSLSFQYERKLERVLSVVDSINSDHGDRETQYQLFAKNALDLMVELIDGGIEKEKLSKAIKNSSKSTLRKSKTGLARFGVNEVRETTRCLYYNYRFGVSCSFEGGGS